jgi:hypothetical protein
MQVTFRGFSRNHGTFVLADEDLGEMWADTITGCPENEALLERVTEDGVVTQLKYRRRVRANLNGNYVLEVSLTSRDAARLCWFAFRNSVWSRLLRVFAIFEREVIEIEERIAKTREEIQRKKLIRRA